METRPTTRLILFLLALKRSLAEKRISVDEFLGELRSANPRTISRADFAQIVQRTIGEESGFSAEGLFAEMTHGGDVLSKDNFKKWFIRMPAITVHKVPASQSMPRPKAPESPPADPRKESVRVGLAALVNYVNSNEKNPSQIFDDCDLDGSGDIDRIEFNKFLFACGLPEFRSRENCRFMIDHVFDDFAGERMSKEEFFTIFRVKPAPVRQSLKRDPSEPRAKLSLLEPLRNLQKSSVIVRPEEKTPLLDKKVTASSKNSIVTIPNFSQNPQKQILIAYEPVIVQGKQNYATRMLPPPPAQFNLTPESSLQPTAPKKPSVALPVPKPSNPKGKYPHSQSCFRLGDPNPEMAPYAEQLERLLASGRVFEDNKNPTTNKGEYRHASELFTGPAQLIQMTSEELNRQRDKLTMDKYIEPGDINQGATGDCYFLCAVAAIVNKYPEAISDLFFFDTNPANYYTIRYFIDGQWVVIKTDDQFPTVYSQFIMTKPKANELWAMLLEKGFAKVYGSYEAINAGNTAEAFLVLTGAPFLTLNNPLLPRHAQRQKEDTKALMKQYDQLGYVMATAGNMNMMQMGKEKLKEIGLVHGHGYSILGVYEIAGETVVKMRNPWGHFEWKGEWSRHDSRWTPELLEKYDPRGTDDDGIFFIGWNFFWSLFGEIQVSKVNPTFVHSSLRLMSHKRKSNYVQMTVSRPGKYHLFICQEGDRRHGGITKFQMSPSRLILMKKNDDARLTFVAAHYSYHQQIATVETTLEKGTYLVSAKIAWTKKWEEHESFLNAYGIDHVVFEKTNRSIAPQFKEDLIESYCAINDGKGQVKSYASEGFRDAYSQNHLSVEEGIAFTKVVNNSPRAPLQVEINFSLAGLKIIKPKRNPFVFTVGPNEFEVIGFFINSPIISYAATESLRIL